MQNEGSEKTASSARMESDWVITPVANLVRYKPSGVYFARVGVRGKLFRQTLKCQKAMDSAAKAVGMSRITHHDLRHLLAARCVESGADIPTVSRWLGHKLAFKAN